MQLFCEIYSDEPKSAGWLQLSATGVNSSRLIRVKVTVYSSKL